MMKPDWDRIQEIYHEARKLPHSERSGFVEKAADGNPVIACEVMDLLAVDDPSFLDTPIVNIPFTSSADNLVGTTVNERYFIDRELETGGMGQLYLARDSRVNDRAVVIKFLLRELLENEYARLKFKQEAEALSRIRHSGVVEVLDTGELPDGRPYFVMQYVEGKTLESQIPNEGMHLEHAASILKQIGAALGHVHEQGVFHRDLKPRNIMLRRGTDSVVLVDFGIAKVADSVVVQTTATGASPGTLAYMCPEQLQGKEITSASDVYSMAVIAYEMVTGRRPFKPNSSSQLLELQRAGVEVKPIALRRNLSPKAQDIILRGLSFKPSARYANANQFGESLAQALVDSGVVRKDRRWLKVLMIVLGVALLSFGIYRYFILDPEPPPPNRSFSYFLTVQKMRDGQPYQTQFKSNGDDTFENGDKFRLTVTTPLPGYVYILNEGAPETVDTSFTMIYPRQAINNGSASLGANQSIESDWITFDGPPGDENLWIVWSVLPVSQLETAKTEAFKHSKGGLTGQMLVTVKQYLTLKDSEIDARTFRYKASQTAVVRGKADMLVTLAQFKHR